MVFCEYIAKALNISRYFLEMNQSVKSLNIRNEKMQELLPAYDIEVEIIERVSSTNGDVISASKVREFLSKPRFQQYKTMMPKPTYQFFEIIDEFVLSELLIKPDPSTGIF
ncbi:hypothetical protein OH492_28490 [Vibrio chagasii]|nr:hypothetical protein [Vibrio chagasii]